ncbi:MAG: hypothetical protein R3C01_06425 [Planctomycetaceae bacterium]
MRTALKLLVLLFAMHLTPSAAMACPMCKNATEPDELTPRAYMYSILFMLSMPATIFGGIGFACWRAHKNNVIRDEPTE